MPSKLLKLMPVMLFALFTSSCLTSGTTKNELMQAYSGDPLQESEVAVVRCLAFETMKSIDGNEDYYNAQPGKCEFALIPGRHVFEVGYTHSVYKGAWYLTPKKIEFEVKKGHKYTLMGSAEAVQTKPKKWDIMVVDMTDPKGGVEVPFKMK